MKKHLYFCALALPALFCAATLPLEGHVLPPPAYSNQNLESVPLGTLGQEKSRILMLDNLTYANIHDLLDDPLLVLRTQFPLIDEETRILAAWEYSAKLNALEDYPSHIGRDQHPMDAMLDPACYDNLNWETSPGLVVNHDPLFDHIKPVFSIDTGDLNPESILWKISRKCEGGTPSEVVVQGLAAYCPQIELTELQNTFLNSDGDYQFQFKAAAKEGAWTEWSAPFDFKVLKPQAVSKPEFNKLSKGKFEISWKASDDPEVSYLVFASNSLDFIPSIYFNRMVKSLAPDSPSNCVECQNLVAITQDNRIVIDGSYAYYRIVAEKRGCRAVPSEIIYVYDNSLSQSRDVLTYDESSQTAFRYAMDSKGVTSTHANAKSWVKSKYISDQDWEKAKPYLMPDNHPMKNRMDRIFKERVTKNPATMKSAGFHQPEPRGLHRPVVSRHAVLPGYLVKLFLDNQKGMNDVHRLTRRAIGAESIAEAIKRLGYRDIFKVPKKWIYVLPDEPSPKYATDRKCFVLLVQDMNILPSRSNRRKWKSSEVKQPTLDALFTIFEDQGLADSVFAFNVPFDHDGYIAIIDTEVHHHWPVPYEKYLKWLNPSNQNYWKSLIKNKPHK